MQLISLSAQLRLSCCNQLEVRSPFNQCPKRTGLEMESPPFSWVRQLFRICRKRGKKLLDTSKEPSGTAGEVHAKPPLEMSPFWPPSTSSSWDEWGWMRVWSSFCGLKTLALLPPLAQNETFPAFWGLYLAGGLVNNSLFLCEIVCGMSRSWSPILQAWMKCGLVGALCCVLALGLRDPMETGTLILGE